MLCGCVSSGESATSAVGAAAESKYTNENSSAFQRKFESTSAAQQEVGQTLREPSLARTSGGKAVGKPVSVTVRDRLRGKDLSREDKACDLDYADFNIAEVPFPTADEAASYVDKSDAGETFRARVRQVNISGRPGVSWSRGDAAITDAQGGTGVWHVRNNTVMWSDGKIVYRIASRTWSVKELLEVAESMY